ncbi:MAG: alpha/beta hydrolase, partial [Microbacteriaceae bacterium]
VQMAGFESAARAYMADCLEQEGCPFTGSVDDGLSQLRAELDAVDAAALTASDGRVLDAATVGTAIAYALYSEFSWPEVSAVVAGLRAGDADPAFRNADGYNSRAADGSYDGNSLEVYTAVTCLDGDFASDPESTLDRLAEIDEVAPTVGRAIALDDFAVLDTVCAVWPEPGAEQPTSYDAEGADPILVIGTTNDPATPYAWAESLADQLSSGVLITYEGEGHTIYAQGVACVDDAVDAYLLEGTVPSADPRC